MVSLKLSLKVLPAISAALVLGAGMAAQVQAEEQVVTVTASRSQESAAAHAACKGLSAEESGRVAREAEKKGAYEQASECFLVAGEYTRAHRASARAAGEAAASMKRNASVGAESARAQLARLRAALR